MHDAHVIPDAVNVPSYPIEQQTTQFEIDAQASLTTGERIAEVQRRDLD
jgi:hypothetical protein